MKFKPTLIASAVLFLTSSSVIAAAVLAPTPSATPAANAAPATAKLRQGVTAQHNAEEQGQAVQIVTGDLSQNELYIFAEEDYVPEKIIAENPDAQIAVLGGSEQKAAQKVKEFQQTVAVVHEKIAKVKAVATIQAQADDQKIQAWNGKKVKFNVEAGKQNIQAMMPKAPALNPSFNHLNPSFNQLAARHPNKLPEFESTIFNPADVDNVGSVADVRVVPTLPVTPINQAENVSTPLVAKAPQTLAMENKGMRAEQVEPINKLDMSFETAQAFSADKIDLIQPLAAEHNKLALNVANVEVQPVHFSHDKLTRAAVNATHSNALTKQKDKPKVVASQSFNKIVKQLSASSSSHATAKTDVVKVAVKKDMHTKGKSGVKSQHQLTTATPSLHSSKAIAKVEKSFKVKSEVKSEVKSQPALTENKKIEDAVKSTASLEKKSTHRAFATKQHKTQKPSATFVPQFKAFVKTGKVTILHRPYKAVAMHDVNAKTKQAGLAATRAYHAPSEAKLAAREHALASLERQLAVEEEPAVVVHAARRAQYSQNTDEHHTTVRAARTHRYASRSNEGADKVSQARRPKTHSASQYDVASADTSTSGRAESLAKKMRDPAQFAKLMQD